MEKQDDHAVIKKLGLEQPKDKKVIDKLGNDYQKVNMDNLEV